MSDTTVAAETPTEAAPVANVADYTIGKKFVFKGYENLTEGQQPIFQPGDQLIIAETPASQAIFTNNGVNVKSATDDRTDTLFDTEMEPPVPSEPPKTRTRGKVGVEAPKATLAAKGKGKNVKPVKAAKKEKNVKASKEPAALVRTDHLNAILNETPNVMDAISGLQDDIEQSYFSLGGLYAVVLHDGLYKEEFPDKNGFNDWCDKYGISGHRQVRHLINIYTKVTAAGFDETELEKIGHTKARVLANHMEHKDFDYKKEIRYAESHTREQIEEHMKKTYVKATKGGTAASTTSGTEKVKKVKFSFTLFGESATMGESAFKKACEIAESEDPNKAWEQIVTDWASLTDGVETSFEQEIARIEHKFGVKLGTIEEGEDLVESAEEENVAKAEPEAAPAPAPARKGRPKKVA